MDLLQREGSQMVVDMIESGKMDQFHREREGRLQMHRGFVTALDQAIANPRRQFAFRKATASRRSLA
jgi:hypothetical protein